MKPSKRVLLLGIILELLLAFLGWFLVAQLRSGALQAATNTSEAISTITQIIGMIMGAVGGLLVVTYVVLTRKERS